jgi:hypothetical protein
MKKIIFALMSFCGIFSINAWAVDGELTIYGYQTTYTTSDYSNQTYAELRSAINSTRYGTTWSNQAVADKNAALAQARKACQAALEKEYLGKCNAKSDEAFDMGLQSCNAQAETGTYQMAGGGAGVVLGGLAVGISATNPIGWAVIIVSVVVGADGAMDQQQGNYSCRDAVNQKDKENAAFCESNSQVKAEIKCMQDVH